MTINERENFITEIFQEKCLPILRSKGSDYSGDQKANSNFQRNAERLGLNKYQIWAVYKNKHTDAVNNAIKHNPNEPQRKAESIEESIIDDINYNFILLSMIREDKDMKIDLSPTDQKSYLFAKELI